jgi:uncharacterized membrane protein
MRRTATVTVLGAREEIERRWRVSSHDHDIGGTVSFKDAPGDRGTEIQVEIDQPGTLGQIAGKLTGTEPLAKAKDTLRRFKQVVETGEIVRSEAVPSGELLERKLKQRPAQPLEQDELQKAGV